MWYFCVKFYCVSPFEYLGELVPVPAGTEDVGTVPPCVGASIPVPPIRNGVSPPFQLVGLDLTAPFVDSTRSSRPYGLAPFLCVSIASTFYFSPPSRVAASGAGARSSLGGTSPS